MSHIAYQFAPLRVLRSVFPRVSHAAIVLAICGFGAAGGPASAGPHDPGPIFGAPGDGPPYLSRLHPRVGWPPVPERRSHVYRHKPYVPHASDSTDYEDPLPPRKPKRRHYKREDTYVAQSHDRPIRSYEDARSYREDDRYENDASHDGGDEHGKGFGRLFERAAHHGPQPSFKALRALGRSMVEEIGVDDPAGDSEMPSGYTFFGQFIDHDVTLETTTDLGQEIRGDFDLKNARTPDLDLDSVYGGGPKVTPHLFRLPYIRVGHVISEHGSGVRHDLFRTKASYHYGPEGGRPMALVGDPRNDENIIISQLHAAFVAFHNRTADILVERGFGDDRERYCRRDAYCGTAELAEALSDEHKAKIFQAAQDHTIHYYHRLIVEDFLPRVIGPRHTESLIKRGRDFFYPDGFDDDGNGGSDIHVPIEFAAAAFRYGHSQVRDSYMLRDGAKFELLSRGDRSGPRTFQPVTPRFLADWNFFFDIGDEKPYGFNHARRLDPEIVRSLHNLRISGVVGMGDVSSLPARNLARSKVFHLPSGQEAARQILPALHARGLLGKSDGGGYDREEWRAFLLPPDERTAYFLGESDTPLWYYILQEASIFGTRTNLYAAPYDVEGDKLYSGDYGPRRHGKRHDREGPRKRYADLDGGRGGYPGPDGGHRLGPVGATIVGEVLTGLVDHYRATTGKGLDYEPLIRGSQSVFEGVDSKSAAGHRYLMRNFLIDAGLVESY